MAVEIKVPAVGESITEGTLARWLKNDGDIVRADEPLFELETEKATSEVPAPADGRLRITVREGQTVAIGTVVGFLETTAGAPRKDSDATPSPPRKTEEKARPAAHADEVLASPAARRLAAEANIDLTQ